MEPVHNLITDSVSSDLEETPSPASLTDSLDTLYF
jgi:hypothetical protein